MKNIAYAFLGPFPKGNVSTVRILSYTKEIVKAGHCVTVYILAPTNDAKINTEKEGVYEGIEYVYLSKITWTKKNVVILVKLFYYFIGIFRFIKILLGKKHNCVISYHNESLFNVVVKGICSYRKIRFNLDITEYPKGYKSTHNIKKNIMQWGLKKYDGIITVSNELESFYHTIVNKKVFKLPITIDSSRYENLVLGSERKNVITCVFGTHNRDGLVNTLEVFRIYYDYCVVKDKDVLRLQIIGDFGRIRVLHEEVSKYYEINQHKEYFKFIDILGQIDNELFPSIISNSKILINTPIRFESGGFPTKLGEYLLSGVPVIYTNAGEVGEVLTNRNNSYLFEPLELDAIAGCILEIQENYTLAYDVGVKGRELALEIFNAKNYVIELLNYCYNENKR